MFKGACRDYTSNSGCIHNGSRYGLLFLMSLCVAYALAICHFVLCFVAWLVAWLVVCFLIVLPYLTLPSLRLFGRLGFGPERCWEEWEDRGLGIVAFGSVVQMVVGDGLLMEDGGTGECGFLGEARKPVGWGCCYGWMGGSWGCR